MGERAMAEGQSKNKDRLIEVLILAFVIVTVGLIVIQMGMNVAETLAQANQTSPAAQVQPVATAQPATPSEPTPTFDISSVDIHDS